VPTESSKGLAVKGNDPEVGVVAGRAIEFSTFSFSGGVRARLGEKMRREDWEHDPAMDAKAARLLERAAAGEDVFDWSGLSAVQERVFRELRTISGTVTYGELARRCGTHPRAVGSVLASNPFAPFVPCHRVVAADGPGGFALGLDEKLAMLSRDARRA
jgi:O-6-methylguanine DNA methyltransferase